MADALASGLAASLATVVHYVTLPAASVPATPTGGAQPVNPNAPAYISPSVSFDPVTGIVFLTFRNAESGKVTEQIPPSQVLSRYRFVDETGIPNPILPRSTPDELAGTATGLPQPTPTPASTAPSGPSSSPTPGTFA